MKYFSYKCISFRKFVLEGQRNINLKLISSLYWIQKGFLNKYFFTFGNRWKSKTLLSKMRTYLLFIKYFQNYTAYRLILLQHFEVNVYSHTQPLNYHFKVCFHQRVTIFILSRRCSPMIYFILEMKYS